MTRRREEGWAVSRRPAATVERASVRMLVLLLLGVVTAVAWDDTAMADSGHPAPTTVMRQRKGTRQWTNEESECGDTLVLQAAVRA